MPALSTCIKLFYMLKKLTFNMDFIVRCSKMLQIDGSSQVPIISDRFKQGKRTCTKHKKTRAK